MALCLASYATFVFMQIVSFHFNAAQSIYVTLGTAGSMGG